LSVLERHNVHTKFRKILAREFKWETHKQTKHTHSLMISKTCFILFRNPPSSCFVYVHVCVHTYCIYCLYLRRSITGSHYNPHSAVPVVKILICVSLYWLATKSKTYKDDRTITALLTVLVSLVMKTKKNKTRTLHSSPNTLSPHVQQVGPR
jgi:hypothetical protein